MNWEPISINPANLSIAVCCVSDLSYAMSVACLCWPHYLEVRRGCQCLGRPSQWQQWRPASCHAAVCSRFITRWALDKWKSTHATTWQGKSPEYCGTSIFSFLISTPAFVFLKQAFFFVYGKSLSYQWLWHLV